jgi:osmotically-inducible protein OsmY
MKLKPLLLAFGLLLLSLALAACGPSAEPQAAATPCPECPACPEAPECPECPEAECPEPAVEVPFEELWASSGHADAEAEAFRHWDEDDPKEVPTNCAKCHSTPGYLDFVGADGTTAGTVDNPAPIGTTVECVACHNEATLVMDSVVMPSGVEITGLGREARCMQCHQGRESTVSVNEAIAEAGVDDDAVSEDLGFRNIHYYAAAATKYGTMAKGGYQYEGKSYDANFAHVEAFDTCVKCHDSHTLELKVEACSECHTGVASAEDLRNVRMQGSLVDYDGDGDVTEGIYSELEGIREVLYQAIQAYASEVAGAPIVYNADAYPYWFTEAEEGYSTWTPRLLKAAYNYQVSVKDPGAYAHGGKYIIELLYDSTEDLDAALVEGLHRIDAGHFAGSEEAFRHWDEDGEVSGSCSKCHSATGLPFYLKEGVTASQPLSNGLLCTTCHDSLPEFTRYAVNEVEFPSGATLSFGEGVDSNLCLECHQGRESTVSVNSRIGDAEDDAVTEGLSFANVHYFAAGATLFGTEAQGAYEYEGKTYNGRNAHVEPYSQCTQCHSTHGLQVKVEDCSTCHAGVEEPEDIRMTTTDFDGDGDTTEGIAGEIATLYEALYAAMQDYATNVAGTGIVYDAHAYPYFFDEAGEGYATWTPRLLRAAYNYQYATKDPGAFAHNGKYIIQVLYDSLEDIGQKASVDMSGMTRP